MKLYIFSLLFTISSLSSFGQQLGLYSTQFANPYLTLPSMVAPEGNTEIFLHHKRQWVDMPDAPEITLFTIAGSPANDRVGTGLKVSSETLGLMRYFTIEGTYRYSFELAAEHQLSFGLEPGIRNTAIRFDKVQSNTPGESSLMEQMETANAFDANIGVTYQYNGITASIAVNNLVNSRFAFDNQVSGRHSVYQNLRHYSLHTAYKYAFNSTYTLYPELILRSPQGMSMQFDINVYGKYKKTILAGIGYKHRYGILFSAGGTLYDKYTLMYAYELPLGPVSGFTGSSHEFSLGIRIDKATLSGKKGREKEKQMEKLAANEQSRHEKIEKIEQKQEKLEVKVEKHERDITQTREEISRLQEVYERDKSDIEQLVKENETKVEQLEDLTEAEVKDSYYIILGVYLSLPDAKSFQKVLERQANLPTSILQHKSGKYLVYYRKVMRTMKEIEKETEFLKKNKILEYINGNLWIYKGSEKENWSF